MRFRSSDDGQPEQPELEVVWYEPLRSVYYLKDHLGSVRATVDDIGQVVAYDDYGPWGMQLEGRSMAAQAKLVNKFTGKERDTDFGLGWDYFGARFYDAGIGRFPTIDPLSEKFPGWSPFNYTLDNPIKLVDPDGSAPKFAIRTGYAGVLFDKYLSIRNGVLNRLNQTASQGGITSLGASVSSSAIESFTPASLAEQYSSSAIGIAGTGLGIGSTTSLFRKMSVKGATRTVAENAH